MAQYLELKKIKFQLMIGEIVKVHAQSGFSEHGRRLRTQLILISGFTRLAFAEEGDYTPVALLK